MRQATAPMDFAFFEAGMDVGYRTVAVAPLIKDWVALFPGERATAGVPAGLLVSIMMRGYLSIIDRRPPGNVHASQRLRWGAAAAIGTVIVTVRCTAKDMRNDKRWLTFVTTVADPDATLLLTGEMRSLWAE